MDTTTVIGVLDDEDAAGQAMSSLREAGFGDLEVLKGGEAEIVADVKGRDFGDEQARAFARAAAAGKVLLAVSTSEEKADRALALLQRKPAPTGNAAERQGSAVHPWRKMTFSGGCVNRTVVPRTSIMVSRCVKCAVLISVIGSAFLRMNSLNPATGPPPRRNSTSRRNSFGRITCASVIDFRFRTANPALVTS